MCRILQIIIICLIFAKIQINAYSTENECVFQDTCERCLSTNLNCAWCTDKKYLFRYRCLTREQLILHNCTDTEIWENEPKTQILGDIELKDYQSVGDHAVQVQPQKVYLKLVKSHPQRVKLTYRPARNNPLDLYYLMDLTWTMRDDKETLVALGAELATTLRNLTVNYRLGFGSFADKPAMPMIRPELRENPCAAERAVCEPTYSYRHHMKLTDNIEDFVRSVKDSRVTGNLDNLEGGLDALMQVIVCPDAIGWKPEARKIVILVTDGFMHFAGDGLLAGITRRNDKQCHLSAEGEYLGALEYDYPSLEEIYRELLIRKVNVIFAVTAGVVKTYRSLSNLIQDVSNVEILSADSSNILELIRKSYESFIKRTQFFDNSPDFIKVDYETDCGGQFSTLRERNFCNDIEMGKEVDFYINVTLTDYPEDDNYTHKIRIEESSLSEYLEIDVEIQRPCPCVEDPSPDDEDGRFQCTENGYMQCGMCHCDEGWTGILCSCATDVHNATTNDAIENMCRQPFNNPQELGLVCSNRGECDCGVCFCFTGFMGKYCECRDCAVDCDPDHANCICGHCVCKDGWTGNLCDCSDSIDSCIGPTGEICSENGSCQCDECECNEPYMGKFCEIGSDLDNKLCTFYEPCVICLIDQKMGNGMCENVSEVCSSAEQRERYTYTFVTEEIDAEVRCLARVENRYGIKCDHYFTYQSLGQSQNYLLIQVNSCEPANYVALVGMLSVGTLILGLLLIWLIMCCLRVKDRREYVRFEQDQRNEVLGMSPIYKDPIGRYVVPKQLNDEDDDNPFR